LHDLADVLVRSIADEYVCIIDRHLTRDDPPDSGRHWRCQSLAFRLDHPRRDRDGV
jgi:hypothetical protein